MGDRQLLDPLATMCKLVALHFLELNTKISINNHTLFLQEPNQMQPVLRFLYRDSRENMAELYHAIIRLVQWYLVPEFNTVLKPNSKTIHESLIDLELPEEINLEVTAISQSKKFRKLVQYLCKALKKLQDTYTNGNVILALQFYINILEDGLKGIYKDNKLPGVFIKKELDEDNFLDYKKIKNLWTAKKIDRVCEMYDNCFAVQDDESMSVKDKQAFIEGYLRSIQSILDSTDGEFQKLIENSNRG